MSARLPIVAKRRATARRRRRALRRWRWERWGAGPVTWAVAEPIIRAAEVRR